MERLSYYSLCGEHECVYHFVAIHLIVLEDMVVLQENVRVAFILEGL